MNTLEGNKLIAEFMGWGKGENYTKKLKFYCVDNEATDQQLPQEMLFTSSWDWLMPVVAKANTIIQGQQLTVNFPSIGKKLQEAILKNNIIVARQCMVKFIQWYNNQNK